MPKTVRPRDRGRVLIVSDVLRLIRILMPGIEEMGFAYATQSTNRPSHILMIARAEKSTTALAKNE